MASIKPEQQLAALWLVADRSDQKMVVLDGSKHSTRYRHVSRFVVAFAEAWSVGMSIRRRDESQTLCLVTQFMTASLPFMWLAASPRRNVVLVVHHNFEQAKSSRLLRGILRISGRLGFSFLVFESDLALSDSRMASLSAIRVLVLPELGPPEPLWPNLDPQGRSTPVVAVVGLHRSEKQVESVLEAVAALAERLDIRPVVGSRLLRGAGQVPEGVQIVDTGSMEDYITLLNRSRVVLVANHPQRYVHRSSGVITDAIICGASVLAPDCPVFEMQIRTPVVAGAIYRDLGDLEMKMRELLAIPEDLSRLAAQSHRTHRRPERVAQILDQELIRCGLRAEDLP